MKRYLRHSIGVLVLMTLLVSCSTTSSAHDRAGVKRVDAATTRPNDRSGTNNATARSTAGAYAAVIRELVTADGGGSEGSRRVIYVLDGAVPSAGDPMASTAPTAQRFDAALKTELRVELNDLPMIRFVSHRDDVVTGTPPGHVIHAGLLLALGPIRPHDAQFEVASSSWANGLNGRWSTYVLTRAGSSWRVVGTSGPVAIS